MSNLNRVRVPSCYIGVKKVYVAAQQIYEINPYANLILYPDGINENNIEDFILGEPKINLIIDEMDNLQMKLIIRLAAKASRLPLVMTTDNGDDVIIDIERFDHKFTGTVFDKLPKKEFKEIVEKIKILPKLNLSINQRVKLSSKIVGSNNVSPRMQESLMEVGRSLYSWPQLGIAAFVGGAALAYVVKKFAIGEELKTGKIKLSLDENLLGDYSSSDMLKKRDELTNIFKEYINNINTNNEKNYSIKDIFEQFQ